jgi:hypothetical protein
MVDSDWLICSALSSLVVAREGICLGSIFRLHLHSSHISSLSSRYLPPTSNLLFSLLLNHNVAQIRLKSTSNPQNLTLNLISTRQPSSRPKAAYTKLNTPSKQSPTPAPHWASSLKMALCWPQRGKSLLSSSSKIHPPRSSTFSMSTSPKYPN